MVQGKPGNVIMVRAEAGQVTEFFTGEVVDHMAVSDGDAVYDLLDGSVPDGIYVTSDELLVYTGGAIRTRVAEVIDDNYSCDVIGMNGVAGSGKTYSIVQGAGPEDVVLCETRRALQDTASQLAAKPGWKGHAYTLDAFLIHSPKVSVCRTLWVDESYRLHGGKIFVAIKKLRPRRVLCFGDTQQVPVLPFVPDFNFVHHEFPFSSVQVKKETYRSPADVCFALSQSEYYGFHVATHNPILRSLEGPLQYHAGIFTSKPDNVPVLTYTKTARDDLRKEGVKFVLTIGEAQGATFDEVYLYREKDLKKALYYSHEYTLVGLTRHRRRLTMVSAAAAGSADSFAERLLAYVHNKASEVLLSSHLCPGVVPVANATEFAIRNLRVQWREMSEGFGSPDVSSTTGWSEV